MTEATSQSTTAEPLRANHTVALDTTGIYVTQAGIARYVKGVVKGLQRVAAPDIHWFPLAWEVEAFGYKQPWRAMRTAYRELFWGKVVSPARMKREHVELFHATSSIFTRVPKNVKHVLTLHDLSISRHPERFRPWQVKSWKKTDRQIFGRRSRRLHLAVHRR